jgi:hypothetical protein
VSRDPAQLPRVSMHHLVWLYATPSPATRHRQCHGHVTAIVPG